MNITSPYTSSMIGTEIFSLIICFILLAGSMMGGKGKTKHTGWYILLILFVIIGCFCDLVSWIWDGHSELAPILYASTLCSMLMTMLIMGVFVSYLSAYISERRTISKIPEIIGWISAAIGVVATVVASFTGNLFTFQDGFFTEESLYSLYVIVNTGFIVIGIIIVTAYRQVLDGYDKIAAYSYMLIPMLSAGISLFVEGWDFTYPSITISILILYIILQSDRAKKLEKEGNIAGYQATHDKLTGLNNRRAYHNCIQRMRSSEANCGVIFGDLNGLKYVNDTLGHGEGDKLLIRYAGILAGIFRSNELYRISGDEFVCIMENSPEEVVRRRASQLEEVQNQESPPIACSGMAYGAGKDIESLIKSAETEMYEKKNVVHALFMNTRR